MVVMNKKGRAQMLSKKQDSFVYYISVPMNLRIFCLFLKVLYWKMESGGLSPEKLLEVTPRYDKKLKLKAE